MGESILCEIQLKPATSCIIGICTAIWFFIQKINLGHDELGMNYRLLVEGDYWRIVTSTFSHIRLIHLAVNMSMLWSLGDVEKLLGLGMDFYIQYTLILVVLSAALELGIYHVLIQKLQLEDYGRSISVGYSSVVFGWMTILSIKLPNSELNLFGILSMSAAFAPFKTLFLLSVVEAQADFIGHLSGIVAGYSVACGLIHGMNYYWFISMLGWVAFMCAFSFKRSGAFDFAFAEIEGARDPVVRFPSFFKQHYHSDDWRDARDNID